MPDLATIHPLLVSNPLPVDRLAGAVAGAVTAGVMTESCFNAYLQLPELAPTLPALGFNEQNVYGHVCMWINTLQPSLSAGRSAVALYAARLRLDLAPMLSAAPFAATEPHALKTVFDGLQVLKVAAVAQQLKAREAALAADSFRSRFARAMVAYVVEIDTAPEPRGQQANSTEQFRSHAKQRQDALGRAISMVASAVSALGALESAWRGLVAHTDILLDQLRGQGLNSVLLLGRLNIAAAEWSALEARLAGSDGSGHPMCAPASVAGAARASPLKSVSAFRNGDINDGTEAVAGVIGVLDSLSTGIAQLPQPLATSAPLVGRHIGAVQQLAHAWPHRGRPSLLGSMAALKQFGDDFVTHDAPRLLAAFQELGDGAAGQPAAGLIGDLIARLAELVDAFEVVRRGLDAYLSEVAGASAELEQDTALVTRRLQDEQARAQALAHRASELQGKLDGAHERQRWHWLLGPLGAIITNEIDVLSKRMAEAANQLHGIRTQQAATISDATYLQNLLPALSSYLTGVDRIGTGIGAALSGIQTLQVQLAELRSAIVARPGAAAGAGAQLQAALADWRDISRKIGHLPPPIA